WGAVQTELNLELAVALFEIAVPDFFPVEIEAGDVAGSHEDEDMLAVGARRRGGFVPLVTAVFLLGAAADLALPNLLAFSADAQEDEVFAILTSKEHPIAPHGRRRAAHAGQLQFPGDIRVGVPGRGQVGFGADAVVRRSAPVRPVVRTCVGGPESESDES